MTGEILSPNKTTYSSNDKPYLIIIFFHLLLTPFLIDLSIETVLSFLKGHLPLNHIQLLLSGQFLPLQYIFHIIILIMIQTIFCYLNT